MRDPKDTVPVRVNDIYLGWQTDKAILVHHGSQTDPVWVPRSLVKGTSLKKLGDHGWMIVEAWVARERNLPCVTANPIHRLGPIKSETTFEDAIKEGFIINLE